MEDKRMRIEANVCPLPEALIQHIQSFLDAKRAARTSILSKSWYTAWSTRPNLDFDQRHFRNRDDTGFWEFAKKTIQRYEALNLKIENFRLWIRDLPDSDCKLAEEFVVKALKLGAVDFNFELKNLNHKFTLPREVLGSETLIRLSVNGCVIDLSADRKACCSKLKSLNLERIWVVGDIIRDLISNCPLIEEFTLSSFRRLHSMCVITYLELEPAVDVPISLCELYNLKTLILSFVKVDNLLFSILSSNFPCLKDLSLECCRGYNYQGMQLSSRSLQCISIKHKKPLRVGFDVPSIRKFIYAGSDVPSLLFETTSREWESDISVTCYVPSTKWFLGLEKLLANLSSSKVSLSLSIGCNVVKSVDFEAINKTAVENLTIHAPCSVWFMVLECLFRCCRPDFVTLNHVPEWSRGRGVNFEDFVEDLRSRNVQRAREICLLMSDELEDVIAVDLSEENFAPQKIHFQLRWRVDLKV